MRWRIPKRLAASIASGAVLPLLACGQKGPLYLPEETGTVVTRPAPTTTEPAPVETPAATPAEEPAEKKQQDEESAPPQP